MKLPNVKSAFVLLLIISSALYIQSCGDGGPTGPDFSTVPPPFDTTQAVDKFTKPGGLVIYVIEQSNGVFEVVERDQVLVHFTGRTKDGTVFDSSYLNGSESPNTFSNLTALPAPNAAGRQNPPLIEGFRKGLLGMVEGEKRTVVIPPSLGYGNFQNGVNGFDLAEDTLIFDIELVDIL